MYCAQVPTGYLEHTQSLGVLLCCVTSRFNTITMSDYTSRQSTHHFMSFRITKRGNVILAYASDLSSGLGNSAKQNLHKSCCVDMQN